ncbi:leucine-rich repeat domain-containing protein [Metamycoplasma faucium]|uniref:Leucine-rich repeat domain-containing protein n=1 Tax=Metamycoplasma faucium TaxID=56142 RepID=A0ABZ2TLL4_9BACT
MKILRKKLKHIKVLASSLGIAVGVQFVAASVLLLRRFWQENKLAPYDWKAEFNKILRTNSTITKDLVKRFVNRPEIDEIILPPNVKELGDGVFSNFKHAKILKITKETGLIGKDAFKNMTSLEEVQIPDKSHIIGTQDLPDNIKIKYGNEEHTKATWKAKWNQENLTLEDSVISLSYNALKECDKIKTLDTNKVEQISANTLPNANLKELTLNDAIKQVIKKELFNPDFSIEKLNIGKALYVDELHNQLKQIKEIKHVKILETISKIDDNAFKDVNIKSIDLASTIKEIGKNAFENSKITEIDLKNTEIISEDAFNASQLKKVTFNPTLKSIKNRAFANCAFDNINFPDNIDDIADDAFAESSILNTLSIGKLLEKANIGKVISNFSMISNLTVKGNIEKIPSMSLANINVNTLTLENGIKEIERKAFDKATIKHLKFGDTIEKIYKSTSDKDDDGTFSNVTKIDTLEIGKGLQNCSDLHELFFYGKEKKFDRFVNLKLTSSIDSLDKSIWNPSIGSTTIRVKQIILDNKFTSLGNETFKNVLFSKINLNNILDLGKQNFVSCDTSLDLDFNEAMTKISDEAFMNTKCFDASKTLNLKNVTEIGEKAFLNSSITKIDLNKVTKIDKEAFANSELFGELDFKQVETIEDSAFSNCNHLIKGINGNISKIGNKAFYQCSLLESINLSNSDLKEIGDQAFYQCKELKNINLEMVETFGTSSFEECKSLDNINFKNAVNIKAKAFRECKGLQNVVEFSKDVSIGDYAFANDINLHKIKLERIISLGISSFYNCSTTSIEGKFNDAITEIPDNCFAGCSYLKEIDFNNVEKIGKYAFANNSRLKIKNTKKLRILDDQAFRNACTKETIDTFDTDSLEEIGNFALLNVRVKKLNLGNLKKIGKNAFQNSWIEEIEDFEKSSIREIPESCFDGCLRLESINLSNIEIIRTKAFKRAENLKEANLSNVKTLESIAFQNAKQLKKVDLSSLTQSRIEYGTFSNCTTLEEVILPTTIKDIQPAAFSECVQLNKINLEKVEKINSQAFYNNVLLKKVDLSSTKEIKSAAFSNAKNLEEVKLSNDLRYIDERAFEYTQKLKQIDLKNVKTINNRAFKNSGLETIDLKYVTKISENAFENVKFTKLSSLKFNNEISIGKQAFKNVEFNSNAEIDFNNKPSTIGEEAFYGIKNVEQIKNGNQVKSVGNKAFAKSSLSGKGLTKENTFPNAGEFGEDVFAS